MNNNLFENNNELNNLIKLIDDEDDFVYRSVKEKFFEYGIEAVIFLKNFINSENRIVAERSSEIMNNLNYLMIAEKMELLAGNENILEDAIFLIAQYEYPEINTGNYKMVLDKMAIDVEKLIKLNVSGETTVFDRLNVLNTYLFTDMGYTGAEKDYYNANNSFINKVMDRKKGIPVSLSALYILIARRLGIELKGVALPSHFILKYKDEKEEIFIDPFNKGILITRKDALRFLKKFGIEDENLDELPFLKIATEKDIIIRTLNNLIAIFTKQNNPKKADYLNNLRLIFEE
jgi:regulator of sirC expression with transglutaminase-like and TPR domain